MVACIIEEEFFMGLVAENWQLAHELEMDVWMHSCGYIIDLLPKLVHAGLDVIANGPAGEYGSGKPR